MKVERTGFDGLFVIEPTIIGDERGYFMESFNAKNFESSGLQHHFVQDNQSHSQKNVIRGLHFQKPPYAQTKLVRVLYGRVLDVVVDLRSSQPTFRKAFSLELSSDNKKQLLIPKGFAHGFSVLSDTAGLFYKCDTFYCAEAEAGIYFQDPELAIDWHISMQDALISQRDANLGSINSLPNFF